jgi:hypothetical protein
MVLLGVDVKETIELDHVLQKFKIKCVDHNYLAWYALKFFVVLLLEELGGILAKVAQLNHIHVHGVTFLF